MNKKATRLFSVLLAVLMVLTVMPVIALSAADAGVEVSAVDADGTLKVYTPEDFLFWASDPASVSRVELQNDIDMAGYDWTPIETWGGTFDGQGYAVWNLVANTVIEGMSSNNADVGAAGGLIDFPQNDTVVKDVAFLNMEVKALSTWGGVHVGMIYGRAKANTVSIENVLVHGKLTQTNNTSTQPIYFGAFAGWCSGNGTVNITNSVFVSAGNDAIAEKFIGFGGASSDSGSSRYGYLKVSDSYIVTKATPITAFNTATGATSTDILRHTFDNVYMTGKQDTIYATYTMDSVTLAYKDTGLASFYEAVGEGNDVEAKHMYGDTMGLSDTFDTFATSLPVPKALKNAQTLSGYITYGKASDYLNSLGASIRLGSTPEKQGIRFMFETKDALALLAQNANVAYGVLVAPTNALNGELTIENEVALIYANANIEGDNIVILDVVDGKFNAALVNFAGVGDRDAFCMEFTVRGFVVVNDTILYLDAYSTSVTEVAKIYIELNAENPDAQDTIAKIEAMLGDHLNHEA